MTRDERPTTGHPRRVGSPDDQHARRIGVLVMAHGTPSGPEEIEPFYTRIRRGRPPTPELLADLRERYRRIGGTSPLAARTAAQVEGLTARLETTEPGRYVVRYGAKHTSPSIEEAAQDLAGAEGLDAAVGLVLAPHRSSMGTGEYLVRAAEALAASTLELGRPILPFAPIPEWYEAPGFAELLAERVDQAVATLDPADRAGAAILYTAHSLPRRVIAAGDPYVDQVTASARLVDAAGGWASSATGSDEGSSTPGSEGSSAAGSDKASSAAGTGDAAHTSVRVAWQSAGRTPEPWIGPDLLGVIRSLPAEGATAVVVCPVGFVSDHLEILYDLDIEAAGVAASVGLPFRRTASLNDDPRFLAVLADVVRHAARQIAG